MIENVKGRNNQKKKIKHKEGIHDGRNNTTGIRIMSGGMCIIWV